MYKNKVKQNKFQREWQRQRRQDWIDTHGPCVQCGSSDRLQVDHVDPTQKITHRIWSWSLERRAAELAKCQVLCYACHLQKTRAQRPKPQHGRDHMYNNGCRCELCKAFKSAKNAKRKR